MIRSSTNTGGFDDKMIGFTSSTHDYDERSEREIRLDNINKRISKFITSIGNFSVQYNFQSISAALIIMSSTVCTSSIEDCRDGDQASWVSSTASAVVFVGAIIGQLTMGYLGDILGRNQAMLLTLSLVVISALLSSIAPHGSPEAIYGIIILFRFFLGIGVGGVYPLSATKAAEDSAKKGNSPSGNSVDVIAASYSFFWQIPGSMTPWYISYLMTFGSLSNDAKWRLLLGLGALPALIVVILTSIEMKIINILGEEERRRTQGAIRRNSYDFHRDEQVNILDLLKTWEIWKKIIATGGAWFIYDVAYYGVTIFGGEILSSISDGDDDNVSSNDSMRVVSSQQLIGLSLGIPACLLSIFLLKKISTKELQLYGFILITIAFILMASLFVYLRDNNSDALFAIYCFLLFTLTFGPNLSTFILPAETFPKNIRATFNGFAAASGKAGAFSGVYLFSSIAEASSYPVVMVVCAIISAIGAIVTYNFVDYKAPPASKSEEAQPLLKDERIL